MAYPPFIDRSSTDATSITSAWPGAAEFTPSDSMVRQNGQPTATVPAPVATASCTRSVLMRLPIRSSIHIRAPPAPQQKERSELRGISVTPPAAAAPIGMLTFSCAATRAVIGDDGIRYEAARLERVADGTPFAGFYTYGEIARVGGIDGFHNQTLVVLAFA